VHNLLRPEISSSKTFEKSADGPADSNSDNVIDKSMARATDVGAPPENILEHAKSFVISARGFC